MDIYELIDLYKTSSSRNARIVAAVINNLNDRHGIKQELQACDADVLQEMFTTLIHIVRNTR
jgi:hypothetical protein